MINAQPGTGLKIVLCNKGGRGKLRFCTLCCVRIFIVMGASLESHWAWLRWALRRWTAHSINSPWHGPSHQISSFPAQALLGGAVGALSPSLPSAQAPAPSTSQPFPLLFSNWDDSWAPILSEGLDLVLPLALASSKFLGYFMLKSNFPALPTNSFHVSSPLDSLQLQAFCDFLAEHSLSPHTPLGNVCLLVLFLYLSVGSPEQRSCCFKSHNSASVLNFPMPSPTSRGFGLESVCLLTLLKCETVT